MEHPVYYVSKTLHGPEVRYLNIEKFALAVVCAARKLHPYFQAHPIVLLTDQPLRKILQKPETSVEFTAPAAEPATLKNGEGSTKQTAREDVAPSSAGQSDETHWTLHVDGSAGRAGHGTGVVLRGPEGFTLEYALRLDFKASNNEAEYEALLAGLSLAAELGAEKLKVHSDSQLVVNHVNGTYEAKGFRMKRYLQKVKEKLQGMGEVEILQVPRDISSGCIVKNGRRRDP
ncbi:uncharacterized protein LOC143863322 [Tasmannia lanceolata]|uniref:uncharacterized protein LOC143863322 n=1 Tax=Tasmannia lanceolata TaxID=3420 RepID=UPI004062BFED